MDLDSLRALLWLASTEAMTPARYEELRMFYDSPLDLWSDFDPRRIGAKLYGQLAKTRDPDKLDRQLEVMEALSMRLIWYENADYPPLLRQIEDPPLALFVRGKADLTHPRQFAIVGARNCTRYGKRQAESIAAGLAQAGVLVVSGLARGIDVAANAGCASVEKPTVAVLGHGLDFTYPTEHAPVAQRILETGGALISEYPPGTPSLAYHFPARNRIISGMCSGLLLVEAAKRSGSMITVRLALEQGREVFALPGPVGTPNSYQPLQLLREGATPISCANDILEDLHWIDTARGPRFAPVADFSLPTDLPPGQDAILKALMPGALSFEQLLENTGLPVGELNSHLTMLEIMEIIEQLPGRCYALCGAAQKSADF